MADSPISTTPVSSPTVSPSPTAILSSAAMSLIVASASQDMEATLKTPTTSHGVTQGCETHDDDNQAGNMHTGSSIRRRTRKLKSLAWKEFEPIFVDGSIVKAKCNHCHELFSAKPQGGTSHLSRHLTRCKARAKVNQIVGKVQSTMSPRVKQVEKQQSAIMSPKSLVLKDWNFDLEASRRELVRMIVLHELPFSIVEFDGFQKFALSLNPLFDMVSRTTLENDCIKAFKDQKLVLQEMFMNSKERVSLTADIWTSNQNMGYLSVTCHFINNEWNIQKRIIRFFAMKMPHDAVAMFNVILQCIQEWHIEEKLFSITLENASVNTAMVELLKANLLEKNMLPVKGKLFHVRCAAHMLNAIVQDGLKHIEHIVDNIRESVKYIRDSQSRKEKFEEIVAQLGISCKKQPCIDAPTCWSSTFLMLESALLFKEAFVSLQMQDSNYKSALSFEEWERTQVVCKILKVLYHATTVVFGSFYPTANHYFHEIWNVKLILEKEAANLDIGISNMVKEMQKKFQKYWKASYLSLSIPVILDPRFKYTFIEFRLNQAFGDDGPTHVAKVNRVIRGLFTEYSSQSIESNIQSMQHEGVNVEMSIEENDPLADWDRHLTLHLRRQVSTELDRYLEESPFPRTEDFDVLNWWMMHSPKYPTLARMARDVLVVPASIVVSEPAFGTPERLISDFQSRLTPDIVEPFICLQDWIRVADECCVS